MSQVQTGRLQQWAKSIKQPKELRVQLKEHQLMCLGWASAMERAYGGGLICDDQGLGKTVEAISLILHNSRAKVRRRYGRESKPAAEVAAAAIEQEGATASAPRARSQRGALAGGQSMSMLSKSGRVFSRDELHMPDKLVLLRDPTNQHVSRTTLVVAPLSVMDQWVRELRTRATGLKVLCYHGPSRQQYADSLDAHDVVVTTYGTLMADHCDSVHRRLAKLLAKQNRDPARAARLKRSAAGHQGDTHWPIWGEEAEKMLEREEERQLEQDARLRQAAEEAAREQLGLEPNPLNGGGMKGNGKLLGAFMKHHNRLRKDIEAERLLYAGRDPQGFGPLFRICWWRVVLDEAHLIKNPRAAQAMACCAVPAGRRWVLSGTPLQNDLQDLYSLFKFLHLHPWACWQRYQDGIIKLIERPQQLKREDLSAHEAVHLLRNWAHLREEGFRRIRRTLADTMLRRVKATRVPIVDVSVVKGGSLKLALHKTRPLVQLPSRTVLMRVDDLTEREQIVYTAFRESVSGHFSELREEQAEAMRKFNIECKGMTSAEKQKERARRGIIAPRAIMMHAWVLLLRLRMMACCPAVVDDMLVIRAFNQFQTQNLEFGRQQEELSQRLAADGVGDQAPPALDGQGDFRTQVWAAVQDGGADAGFDHYMSSFSSSIAAGDGAESLQHKLMAAQRKQQRAAAMKRRVLVEQRAAAKAARKLQRERKRATAAKAKEGRTKKRKSRGGRRTGGRGAQLDDEDDEVDFDDDHAAAAAPASDVADGDDDDDNDDGEGSDLGGFIVKDDEDDEDYAGDDEVVVGPRRSSKRQRAKRAVAVAAAPAKKKKKAQGASVVDDESDESGDEDEIVTAVATLVDEMSDSDDEDDEALMSVAELVSRRSRQSAAAAAASTSSASSAAALSAASGPSAAAARRSGRRKGTRDASGAVAGDNGGFEEDEAIGGGDGGGELEDAGEAATARSAAMATDQIEAPETQKLGGKAISWNNVFKKAPAGVQRRMLCKFVRVPGSDAQFRCAPFVSAKMRAVLQELKSTVSEDPSARFIIFSNFTSMLDVLELPLHLSGFSAVRLDGRMKRRERSAAVHRFETDPSVRVFLISIKAGGLGLNLVSANHVFIMDPWYNAMVEEQAIDRVHRIGQTRPVRVVRFMTRATVEETLYEIQLKKRRLIEGTLGDAPPDAAGLTLDDMDVLLSGKTSSAFARDQRRLVQRANGTATEPPKGPATSLPGTAPAAAAPAAGAEAPTQVAAGQSQAGAKRPRSTEAAEERSGREAICFATSNPMWKYMVRHDASSLAAGAASLPASSAAVRRMPMLQRSCMDVLLRAYSEPELAVQFDRLRRQRLRAGPCTPERLDDVETRLRDLAIADLAMQRVPGEAAALCFAPNRRHIQVKGVLAPMLDSQTLLALSQCQQLESLQLTGVRAVSDKVIREAIFPLSGLRRLDLGHSAQAVDLQLLGELLERLPKLESLGLSGAFALAGYKPLELLLAKPLKALDLSCCGELRWVAGNLSDESRLAETLESLDLSGCDGIGTPFASITVGSARGKLGDTEEDLDDLEDEDYKPDVKPDVQPDVKPKSTAAASLPAAAARRTPYLTGALALITRCRQLRRLSIGGIAAITNDVASRLAQACDERLESISLRHTSVGDDGVRAIVRRCRQLQDLDLYGCRAVTTDGLKALHGGAGRGLKALIIGRIGVGSATLPPEDAVGGVEEAGALDFAEEAAAIDADRRGEGRGDGLAAEVAHEAEELADLLGVAQARLRRERQVREAAMAECLEGIVAGHGLSLGVLNLEGWSGLEPVALADALSSCPKLEELDLSWCTGALTDHTLGRVLEACPQLRHLSAWGAEVTAWVLHRLTMRFGVEFDH